MLLILVVLGTFLIKENQKLKIINKEFITILFNQQRNQKIFREQIYY